MGVSAPATASTPALAGTEASDVDTADGASPQEAEAMADVDPAVAPTRPAARHIIHIPKNATKGRNVTSGPTLDHLRTVATDARTEAAHHAPDATFASERIREIFGHVRGGSPLRLLLTCYATLAHRKRRGQDGTPIPSQYRPRDPPQLRSLTAVRISLLFSAIPQHTRLAPLPSTQMPPSHTGC